MDTVTEWDSGPDLQVGSVVDGPHCSYRLTRLLGRGGMGSVFLADVLPPPDGKPSSPGPERVALKVLQSYLGDGLQDMLRRELSALRALRHPRVAHLLDARLSPSPGFMVFPYYDAGSMLDSPAFRIGFPVEEAWKLLEHLLEALVSIHRACILHLDIKPGNVLIDQEGGYVLADFGIAQGSRVPRTAVRPGLGTELYQAPEQAERAHERLDVRSDLWGVGITTWAALAGKSQEDLSGIRQRHQELLNAPSNPHKVGSRSGMPSITDYRPDCPPQLDRLLSELLQIRQDARPGSAAEVLAQLHRERDAWRAGQAQIVGPASGPQARVGSGPLAEAPLSSDCLGTPLTQSDRAQLIEDLLDPLWRSLLVRGLSCGTLRRFPAGSIITSQGEKSYWTLVLLDGRVAVARNGAQIAAEEREGTFLGEVTALTGGSRTASLVAETAVTALVLNPAELEYLLAGYPAVSIRLIKDLATRLEQERLSIKNEDY